MPKNKTRGVNVFELYTAYTLATPPVEVKIRHQRPEHAGRNEWEHVPHLHHSCGVSGAACSFVELAEKTRRLVHRKAPTCCPVNFRRVCGNCFSEILPVSILPRRLIAFDAPCLTARKPGSTGDLYYDNVFFNSHCYDHGSAVHRRRDAIPRPNRRNDFPGRRRDFPSDH